MSQPPQSTAVGVDSRNEVFNSTGFGPSIVFGQAGNDVIIYPNLSSVGGAVFLSGGDGNDIIDFSGSGDASSSFGVTIYGDRGRSETIAGPADGNDHIIGFAGTSTDTIYCGGGNDYANANAGGDVVFGGAGDDRLLGGAGADLIFGDAGNDLIYGATPTAVAGPFLQVTVEWNGRTDAALAAPETYTGAAGPLAAADAGPDSLYGGAGDDMMWGGFGADLHDGGAGIDYARYDDGNPGDIRVSLDNAANTAIGTGAAAGDSFNDVEGLILGAGNDTVYGDVGSNYIYGQGGNDNIYGSLGADFIDGGDGFDYTRFDDADYAGLVCDLAGANTSTGAAAGDVYVNIEGLILTGNSDMGFGNALGNYLYGLGGADTLDGREGADFLDGGLGDDSLDGGTGVDTMVGGSGSDIFRHRGAGFGTDTVTDFAGGTGAGDRINLQGLFASFAGVLATSVQIGADLHIIIGGVDRLILQNFSISNLAADDVIL
jgi:Ca2+-binding RTX toxin-like protein